MRFVDLVDFLSKISSSFMTVIAFITILVGWKVKIKGGFKVMVRDAVGIDEIKQSLDDNAELIKKQSKSSQNLQSAMTCVLRKEIKDICEKCIENQYITNDELEMLTQEFDSYVKLGGNSFIHDLVDKAKGLPCRIAE
jgi:hypothetical protein